MIVVENRATQDRFLRPHFVIFRCQKYVKKGYIEVTKKSYLETCKKCPGSLCFPLLASKQEAQDSFQNFFRKCSKKTLFYLYSNYHPVLTVWLIEPGHLLKLRHLFSQCQVSILNGCKIEPWALNSLSAKVAIIWKPSNLFSEQVNWLVSIW